MGYKVFVYSSQPIIEVGLISCVKKGLPEATIIKTNSLDVFSVTEPSFNCDLFIFDVFYSAEFNFINQQLSHFINDKKVIFLIENEMIEASLKNNNINYLHKYSSEREIVKCMRSMCKIHKPIIIYKSVTKKIQSKSKFSAREMQCANLLMKGYSIGQISKELSLEMNTISTYKQRLHKKTNTSNLVQLIKTLYTLK